MTGQGSSFSSLWIASLILVITFLLSFFFRSNDLIRGDFVLVTLLTISPFLGFFEVLAFGLLSVFMLSWQPGLSFEAAMTLFLPLGMNLGYRFLPGRSWLQSFLSVFLGLVIFYLTYGVARLRDNLLQSFELILVDMVFWGIIFLVAQNYLRASRY